MGPPLGSITALMYGPSISHWIIIKRQSLNMDLIFHRWAVILLECYCASIFDQ
jgi:hypothetical protein